MKDFIIWVFIICLSVSLGFGGWYLTRKINYSLSYKMMVKQTIEEMVKKECLK